MVSAYVILSACVMVLGGRSIDSLNFSLEKLQKKDAVLDLICLMLHTMLHII